MELNIYLIAALGICAAALCASLLFLTILLLRKGSAKFTIAGCIFAILAVLLTIFILSCFADIAAKADTPAETTTETTTTPVKPTGKAEAASIGKEGRGELSDVLKAAPDSDIVPGYIGTNVPEKNITDAELRNALEKKHEGGTKDADTALRSAEDFEIKKETLKKQLAIQEDPTTVEGFNNLLSSSYEDCSQTTTASTTSRKERCDGWKSQTIEKCEAQLALQHTFQFRWECEKDTDRTIVVCDRELIKHCDRRDLTNDSGEALRDPDFTRRGWMQYRRLDDGGFRISIPNCCNYGERDWGIHDGTFTFTIDDPENFSRFMLGYVQYANYGHISVNGTRVLGDNYPICTAGGRRCRGKGNDNHYSRGTRNIDLRPHLRKGRNTILVSVAINDTGGFGADFSVSYYSCAGFEERWVETCPE